MDPATLSALLGGLQAAMTSIAGPMPAMGFANARAAAGFSDPAMARSALYFQERKGVENVLNAAAYIPLIHDPSALIKMYHQAVPLGDGLADGEIDPSMWAWLKDRLRNHGIDLAGLADAAANPIATDWRAYVSLASTAAPLDAAIAAWHRTLEIGGDEAAAAFVELQLHLRRAGYSRIGDRQLLLSPFHQWSTDDALRAFRFGLVDAGGYDALLRAGGIIRTADADLWHPLSQYLPGPELLLQWAGQRLWDEDFAAKWGLDEGYDGSAVARFFANAQGLGLQQFVLPDQPGGVQDWGRLQYRGSRQIIDYATARQLQFRLRPDPNAADGSVIPGVPAWLPADTIEHLQRQGWSDEYIERLMAITPEPLNVRIINEVLTEALKHPAVAAQAQADFGEGVDWVQGAFLDHGFTEPVAALAASALRAKADDEANAERLEAEKQLRAEHRAAVIESYKLGLINRVQAIAQLQGRFFTEAMAGDAIQLIDESFTATFTAGAIGEIEKAFMAGKINIAQVGVQLNALGIIPDRQANYVQRWVWAKSDDVRMASTGEIIAAAKAGLITGPVALTRLTNLGWTAPDAMLELALAQHELDQAAAHAQATEQAKQIAAQQRAEAKAEAEAKAKAKADAAAARAAKAAAAKAAGVPLEAEVDAQKYGEAAEKALDAYNKAKAKGDDAKAQAEIDAAIAAYGEMLLHDLRLRQESPEVAKDAVPVPEIPVPSPPANQGAG
jgi:hypothetical protein